METAVILEIDVERDRKACIHLDLKVTGANRELAQWLADHRQYSMTIVAGWLGCGPSRIGDLRLWAESGFSDEHHPTKKRLARKDHRRAGDGALESLDNPDEEAEVADPEEIEDNVIYTLARMNEHAKVFNKLFKLSAFDSEAEKRMVAAIGRTIRRLELILATLTKRRRRHG